MWHCDVCDQNLPNPVAHYDKSGEICPGHPEERTLLEEDGYTLSKRLLDALFISLPFSITFFAAYLATEMTQPTILLAAVAIPSCSSLYALLVSKEGQFSD